MKRERYYLYALTDPREPKNIRYVGITSQTLEKRLSQHISDSRCRDRNYKSNWIRSLLSEGVKPNIELLDSLPSWNELCESEIQTIKALKEIGYKLVNATDGGEGYRGYNPTKETRAKISAARKGHKVSDETRAKISASHIKNKHLVGFKHSEETRAKMSAARRGNKYALGHKHSEETRKKISAAKKGIPISAEHRAKISALNKGKSISEEHKAALSKPITDQHGSVYKSISEAARLLGLKHQSISKVLKGKRKQTGGFTFQYYSQQQG